MWMIIFLVYTGWAIYSGYNFLSGRSEWLDNSAILNRIVKIVLSIVLGYFIGAFYFIYLILKFLGIMGKM